MVVIAPTMAMRTPAIAEMIAFIPPPIAENIDPMILALLVNKS